MSDSDNRNRLPRFGRKDNGRKDRGTDGTGEPRFRLWQARAALTWERLWPAIWLGVTIIGGFLALALLGVFGTLPGWLHLLVLLLFAGGIGFALYRGLKGFVVPDESTARRRLEQDSGLPHRPLNALRDRVAGGDALAAELWRLHQERMRASVRRLRVSLPRPNVPAHDRYALRALVALVLFVAAGLSWGDWGPRLATAFTPQLDGGATAATATLDLWVTPPEYTGLPPVFLKSGGPKSSSAKSGDPKSGNPASDAVATAEQPPEAADAPVSVPVGSLVLARVTGGSGTPTLEAGDRSASFEAVDSSTFQIQQPIESGDRITVTQGRRTLGSWNIALVPDAPPAVSYVTPPAKGERGALRLEFAARDDYGLAEVKATIRPAPQSAGEGQAPAASPAPDEKPIELPLPLSGLRPKEARNASFHDLTAHPWAGSNVLVRITAIDGAGQTGKTEDVEMLLPERVFNHPIARAIVAERKRLTQRPDAKVDVARSLSEISSRVGDYAGDPVAFLGMRTAVARLMLDESDAAVPAVQQLLWDTALRIEDGGLSMAERNLRDAEQRLAEALDRNASDAELNQLMDELQNAMNEFMDAMEQQFREALERGEQIPMVPPGMADRMIDRNDLQQMMDQMRQMAETGSRDAARQMLSQLQQMMENMRSGAMAQMQPPPGGDQAWQMMQELEELSRKQQQLLDQTFQPSQQQMGAEGEPMPGQQGQTPRGRQQGQRGQQGQQGQPGSPTMQQQAEQQEALRRELGDLMRRMGEMMGDIPRPLGRAERAMRDSGQALGQGQPWDAVPPQTQAMDELQQGMQSYAEQLMNQMMGGQQGQPMPGQMMGQQQGPSRNRDPLGRRPAGFGNLDNDGVKVPEQSDLQRAREILDELRRRSGEYDRPRMEREYIDRLLKQF